MKPIILFRPSHETKEELKIAENYFDVTTSRMDLYDSLVIGRYSVLPHYNELEADLKHTQAKLINSHLEHQYVANFDYYDDLREYTAQSWTILSQVPKDSGPWIIKGRTNSRKFQWRELMYAETWADLVDKHCKLSQDHLLGPQGLVIRKFLQLELVEEGLTNPMFNEWRFFFYKAKPLAHGWYWSNSEEKGVLDEAGLKLAQYVADQVKDRIPFVCIDIARKMDGSWVLVELNDGQMSGLSEVDPHELYGNLKKALTEEE